MFDENETRRFMSQINQVIKEKLTGKLRYYDSCVGVSDDIERRLANLTRNLGAQPNFRQEKAADERQKDLICRHLITHFNKIY